MRSSSAPQCLMCLPECEPRKNGGVGKSLCHPVIDSALSDRVRSLLLAERNVCTRSAESSFQQNIYPQLHISHQIIAFGRPLASFRPHPQSQLLIFGEDQNCIRELNVRRRIKEKSVYPIFNQFGKAPYSRGNNRQTRAHPFCNRETKCFMPLRGLNLDRCRSEGPTPCEILNLACPGRMPRNPHISRQPLILAPICSIATKYEVEVFPLVQGSLCRFQGQVNPLFRDHPADLNYDDATTRNSVPTPE